MPGTDFLDDKILGAVIGGVDFAHIATPYLALFTTQPDHTGAGTEVTASEYARQPCGSTNTAAGSTLSNTLTITFPTSTSTWGAVTYFAIFDAATGGNMVWWDTLGSPFPFNVTSGVQIVYAAGTFTLNVATS